MLPKSDVKGNHTSQPPTNVTILSLYNKFKETDSVHDLERSGPPPSVVIEEKAEVRNLLAATPYTSIRKGAAQIGISKSTYSRILNKLDFHNIGHTSVSSLATTIMIEESSFVKRSAT